jgi:putative membrane protein
MLRADRFLTAQETQSIEAAIAEAEKKTAAEIRCAVATESGRYDRAEAIVGLIGALLCLMIANVIGLVVQNGGAMWGTPEGIHLGWQATAVVLGFVGGTVLAGTWHALRRVFVHRRELAAEVRRAAWNAFALGKISSTEARTGLLIYLSLFERRVMVLADQHALDILGQDGVNELRDLALDAIRGGERVETFLRPIRAAAEKLAPSLPPKGDNPDELPNRLLIFHPRP